MYTALMGAAVVPDTIPTIPVFDFNNPWVAIIQIALLFVLPKVTQKIVSLWADGLTKTAVLGVLSVLASGLTWLLDVAVANAWASADWTALINVLVNALLVWGLGSRFFDNVISKSANYKESAQTGLNLFENPQKRYAAAKAEAEKAAAEIAAAQEARDAAAAAVKKATAKPRATTTKKATS